MLNEKAMHPSDSTAQRVIEEIIVKKIATQEGCVFSKTAIINDVTYVFDFHSEERRIMGEVYAGIVDIKGGQVKKVITDCFKMVAAERNANRVYDKRIIFLDKGVMKKFEGKSWSAHAIKQFGIQLVFETIDESEMSNLIRARQAQQNSNIMKSKN